MGFFKDSKFEELDWISQAVEPINSPLNELLSELPDSMDINFHVYYSLMKGARFTYLVLDKSAIINYMINHRKSSTGQPIPDGTSLLDSCFKFEITGNPSVDYSKRAIYGGTITLIKTTSTLEDKALLSTMGHEGLDSIWRMNVTSLDANSRANEVMELLGSCEKGIRARSIFKKRNAVRDRLQIIFNTNEWNIKDTTLANKIGFWIADYIGQGKMSAFANFCKLKVMTHRGQPIYSMEEIV